MFDTHKKESMNNVISYVAPKNYMTENIMSLNSRISCVVGIYIQDILEKVFALMEIQATTTFKQFLQAETLNAKKKKSYDQ